MSDLHTPTLTGLFKELEEVRSIAAQLQDYRNANTVLTNQYEQVKEQMAYLQDRAEKVAEDNTRIAAQMAEKATALFEAQADRLTFETQSKRVMQELEDAQREQTNLRAMNEGLNTSITNLQRELELVKEELEQKDQDLASRSSNAQSNSAEYRGKLEQLNQKIAESEKTQADLRKMNESLNDTINQLQSALNNKVSELEAKTEAFTVKISELEQNASTQNQHIKRLKQRLEESERNRADLRRMNESLNNSLSSTHAAPKA